MRLPIGLCGLLLSGVFTLLHGCSGDARPLVEAIEVEELGLESLQIRPPARSLEETPPGFSVSTGQQVQFSLIANGGDDGVEVPATDRQWRVSDSSVASITGDGLLEGRLAGTVQVGITIGGIAADDYEVTVSDAALAALDEVIGDAALEPCLPENYNAAGSYADGTRRLVPDVSWALGDEVDAESTDEEGGSLRVLAREAGALTLTASAADATPLVVTLNVNPTLSGIEIEPATDPLSIDIDDTLDLSALGQYSRDEGDSTTSEDITDYVDWVITTGEQFASVDNDLPDDRGQITGLEAGSATVTASCGNTATDTRQVDVSESTSSSGTGGLVFDQESPLLLDVGESVTLRVATGSDFDVDNEVTDETSFSVGDSSGIVTLSDGTGITTGTGIVIGNNDGQPTNVVTGQIAGTTTVSAILDDGTEARITVQVQ